MKLEKCKSARNHDKINIKLVKKVNLNARSVNGILGNDHKLGTYKEMIKK